MADALTLLMFSTKKFPPFHFSSGIVSLWVFKVGCLKEKAHHLYDSIDFYLKVQIFNVFEQK